MSSAFRRNNACDGFLLAVDGFEKAIEKVFGMKLGILKQKTPDSGMPFIQCNAVFAEQLLLTKELLGCSEEKEYDFAMWELQEQIKRSKKQG